MIEESIRIKLSQFMLAYERQCAQLQFQRQNIKQNVMLSIIENRNAKKTLSQSSINYVQKPMTKSKLYQNLASSKETKLSQDKEIEIKSVDSELKEKQFEELERSKLISQNSRLMQRSNVSIKDNKSTKLTNNFMKQNASNIQQPLEQPVQKERKSGMLNNPYYVPRQKQVQKQVQIEEINEPNEQHLVTFNQRKSFVKFNLQNQDQNKSQVSRKISESQLNQQPNNLTQSSISRRSSKIPIKQIQRQLQQAYEVESQSQVFQRNTSNRVYRNSQKVIKQNPSLVVERREQEQNFATFQKPSFQFINNLSELRQSNPHQDQDQDEQQLQQEQQERIDPQDKKETYGKWLNKRRDDEEQDQQQDDIQAPQETFNKAEEDISDIHEDESMMIASQFNQKSRIEQPRRSSFAFQINMEKSNLPANQNLEQLKKKKILQLQRKRQQRIENNSKRKQNSSQITNNSKQQPQKGYSNVFVANKNTPKRDNDNRDSLNKSVHERKNDTHKNVKKSGYHEEDSQKESAFHDNRTVITKYGQESKFHNRSISPLNTVKTIHTDKRPPMNRNKKEDNIFAGESTFQRDRSSQKLNPDPKIIPIDRKNSFQKKSNIKIMINAITYTCLPGELNRRERQKLIDVLDDYENQYFVFVFKEYSRKVIKGIYIMDGNQERLMKIYGDKAPNQVFPQQVHQFYRFDSGSREFKKIDGCKSFSFSIHAVDLR